MWGLERSTNSDTRNALRGSVLPFGGLDKALDWYHETVVKQPKIDYVNAAADLLKPPCVPPPPVMGALEAMNHLEDLIFSRKNFFHDELIGSQKSLVVPEAPLCLGFGV